MTGFIEDSKPADALWAIILRSQVYCGEIEDIICPKVPKDITIISTEDIPGSDFITVLDGRVPVLAGKRVNYAGEPILLIAGPELGKLRSFALQIAVTYKTEKPSLPGDIQKDIVYEKNFSLGKPDKIFKKAFQIIEGEYITPWQEHHISDAGGALAVPEGDTVRIQCPSAWLFHVRNCVADVCKIPRQKVIVEQSKMSASFDGRIWYPSLLAVHAALLAGKTEKPVFLLTPRDEELAYTPKRLPVTCKLKTAVDPDGNLLAIEAEALVNTGAYAVMTEELSFRLACGIKGIYKCENFSISVKCYRTNYPPFNTFRGLAAAQGFFASELHTTRLAELSQDDPAAWKKSNLVDIPLRHSPGFIIQSLLEKVSVKADFSRKHSAYEIQNKSRKNMETSLLSPRGIGISCAYQINGFCSLEEDNASVKMILDAEDSLSIHTSIVPVNTWVKTQWIEMAAEILAIDKKSIRLECGSTESGIDTGPDIFGRNTSSVIRLIKRCATAIAKQRFRSPLPLTVKRSQAGKSGGETSLINLIDDKSADISWGSCVLELEMDLFSLLPSIKGIWLAFATNIIRNKKLAASTIESAVLQSLQWCSKNSFMPFQTDDFLKHFHLPRISDVPFIHISFLEDKQRQPVGIDDIADMLIPPAYLSAISQATGYYFDRIPATPLQIANSMEAAEET